MGHAISSCIYLADILNAKRLKEAVENTVKAIKDSGLEFDTIAFTGVSGALVAPAVCMALNKVPTVVRKEKSNNHSCRSYEGLCGNFKYIIVDDGIATGCTALKIIETMKLNNPGSEFMGFFGYRQYGFFLPTIPVELEGKFYGYTDRCGTWERK